MVFFEKGIEEFHFLFMTRNDELRECIGVKGKGVHEGEYKDER